jgi:fumarylacetoacetase
LKLSDQITRSFLEDGDEIVLAGYCAREGFARIGLGVCHGLILPALDPEQF